MQVQIWQLLQAFGGLIHYTMVGIPFETNCPGKLPARTMHRRHSPAPDISALVVLGCAGYGAFMGYRLADGVDSLVPNEVLIGGGLGLLIGIGLLRIGNKVFKRLGIGPSSKLFGNASALSPQAQKVQDQKAGILTGEDLIQRQILDWLASTRPDIFAAHIPNGGHTSWRAAHLMRVGMVKGMPDLILIGARGQVGFMEVKTEIGSLRKEQRSLQNLLTARGLPHAVVRSPQECDQALRSWGW